MELKKRIDSYWNTIRNPNWSITYLVSLKFLVLSQFFIQFFKNIFGILHLKKMREFRDSGYDSIALVLGNGPIEKHFPYEIVNLLQNDRKIYVYGVNFVLNSSMVKKITINNLILSDPKTLDLESDNEKVKKLWANIKKFQPNLFIPYSYQRKIQEYYQYTNSIYLFNDLSLETISKNINPIFPRGYPSSTFLKAFAIALYANHQQIFITGADQSMFTKISVDESNRIIQFPSHKKGAEGGDDNYENGIDITPSYHNGLADYFFDISNLHLAFRAYFKNDHQVNYIGSSYHDFYKKISTKNFKIMLEKYT
jgi:hypothetical protein